MPKTIITAAVTGNIHVPSMSPYLPATPQQIIDDAVKSALAGAAVVHVHAREPEEGKPTTSLDVYEEILTGIKARTDAVVCVTTGGTAAMTAEERIAVVSKYKPEIASFNSGSMNFSLHPIARTIDEFKYEWEKKYLEGTENFVFTNHFQMMGHFCNTMKECRTLPELEVYDVGMINNAAFLVKEGLLEKPLYIQFVMGILGGIPATIDNLLFLYHTAKNQLGDFNWSVCAAGRHQFPMVVTNMLLGGNVRVGLEDNLYLKKGVLARGSYEQVEKTARIANELGIEVATPAEARKELGLKGKSAVNY